MPELTPHPYEHRRPRRPLRLARRTEPPPERPAPPDLTWLMYIGIALAAVLAALAAPYLVGFLISLITG